MPIAHMPSLKMPACHHLRLNVLNIFMNGPLLSYSDPSVLQGGIRRLLNSREDGAANRQGCAPRILLRQRFQGASKMLGTSGAPELNDLEEDLLSDKPTQTRSNDFNFICSSGRTTSLAHW